MFLGAVSLSCPDLAGTPSRKSWVVLRARVHSPRRQRGESRHTWDLEGSQCNLIVLGWTESTGAAVACGLNGSSYALGETSPEHKARRSLVRRSPTSM